MSPAPGAPVPMDVSSPHNLAFAEALYLQYLDNASSVEHTWRAYFDSIRPAGSMSHDVDASSTAVPKTVQPAADAAALHEQVYRLVSAYRSMGHNSANLDVLGLRPRSNLGPALSSVGLSEADLDRRVLPGTLPLAANATRHDVVALLHETYCRSIGVEFAHILDPKMRHWLQTRMEATRNRVNLTREEQLHLLGKLTDAEVLETFLQATFVGAKRFSLEGAESLIPMLDLLIQHAAQDGVREIVLGMAHRGRLNVLVNIMGQDAANIFAAFDDSHPETHKGAGDVKYHLGYSVTRQVGTGQRVHLSLAFNPSHLEWVNCVVEGRVRARQDRAGDAAGRQCMPIVVHGDAAFAGQGLVMETMQLSELKGYRTGGTIHVIVNNQVGFTTPPEDARSTPYCSDIGRMFHIPIFHVNGEDPEAVAQVVTLALQWRQEFAKDVIIDLSCYRKHGHSEGDEPAYTQPAMYRAIAQKQSVRKEYITRLLGLGQITEDQAEALRVGKLSVLDESLKRSRESTFRVTMAPADAGPWERYRGGSDRACPEVDTAIPHDVARTLLTRLATVPEGFAVHPKLVKWMDGRKEMALGQKPVDWGAAEALAFASLVAQGFPVRVSGQDSRRGTFAHRHAVLRSFEGNEEWTPLAHVATNQARFDVWDSPLSEAGVLGFDYGYSMDDPDALVVWEAQFGDFVNAAQVIIDQFITSAEAKWNRLSGITLFLPHGYEGQGPEHSSARVGRFLHLCANDNIQVCNVTSPAQLFHVLRRQVLRPFRKPLVLFTPKSLLRHKAMVSGLQDFLSGAFQRVLPDARALDKARVQKIVLCSGKVFFDLDQARAERNCDTVAIVRLEQLYPWPDEKLGALLATYPQTATLSWVQEEPWNQGGWHFVRGRPSMDWTGGRVLSVVCRPESSSPATGSAAAHKMEQQQLVEDALKTVL